MDVTVLEVVVGLSFLFFLISVVASAINEGIAGVLKTRSTMLEKGIINLLTGTPHRRKNVSDQNEPGFDEPPKRLVESLLDHSLITGYSKDQKLPSYLASRSFRNALFDVGDMFKVTQATPDTTAVSDPLQLAEIDASVRAEISKLPIKHLQESLLTIWNGVDHDLTEFRAGVERWFDRGMERVSGWYKRRAQILLLLIGLALAFAVNADAVRAAGHLWKDDGKRDSIVAASQNQPAGATSDDAIRQLDDVGFPIGWDKSNRPDGAGEIGLAVLGWLITGVAVTLGAPFWFDVLNKVSNLRAAGRKPDTSLVPAPTKTEVASINLNVTGGTAPGSTPPTT
jgi:hypothetical protein